MLTVGMATHRDFDGVYFTVQALRLYAGLPDGSEIVVIDNAPDSPEGKAIRNLANSWWAGDVRYVASPETVGTAAPRDRVFREAKNGLVLCVDCHVMLRPGAVAAFLDFFAARPGSLDLVQGPLLYDDARNAATHFSDVWGAEMWGKWAESWVGRSGNAVEVRDDGTVWTLSGRRVKNFPTDAPPADVLRKLGFVRGHEATRPFEIPAMGLGLFGCRKEAWLGFNPEFRGFGGEEWYVHEKYRKAGRKTWCVPQLQWVHRFGRPGRASTYPLSKLDKMRNYVIGLTEVGIPLDRAKTHFLSEGATEADWQAAVEGKTVGCGCQQSSTAPPEPVKPDDLYATVVRNDPGVSLVRQHATGTVIEFTAIRGPATIAILAAKPGLHLSYSPETLPELDGKNGVSALSWREVSARPCDLLVLTLREDVASALLLHGPAATRVVVNGPVERVKPFLAAYRAWRIEATKGGYTLLTRSPKRLPPLWRRLWNYARALWRRGYDFGELKGRKFELRLAECEVCPSRVGDHCGECGCPIKKKASWPTEACPLGKWP